MTINKGEISEWKEIKGGCLCGEIRYESSAPPTRLGYCHCGACRKAYGHLYIALVQFTRDAFQITQGVSQHFQTSELAKRSFCRTCGSSLTFSYEGQDSLFVLHGTLDSPDDWPIIDSVKTWGHAFTSDKVYWLQIHDGLPQHSESAGFLTDAFKYHKKNAK